MFAAKPPAVTVSLLWAEGRGRSDFLATATPTLSWQLETDAADWVQESYVLECRVGSETSSTEIVTDESQHQPWPASPLSAWDWVAVRVRVTGRDGSVSAFCPWVTLRTGPLTAEDWVAPFIALDYASTPDTGTPETSTAERGTVRFRNEFTPTGPISSAVLSATAHGIYEATINGHTVGDELLAPGWTTYNDRLLFQSYDVTALLRDERTNVLGATVADGWYGERFGFDGNFDRSYPGPVALSMQLRVEYASGAIEVVPTDHRWSATSVSPIVSSGIYPGERYDARLEDDALEHAGEGFAEPRAAVIVEADPARLAPSSAPPVRRIERVAAKTITKSPSGKTLVDFGQNLVGWLEITVDLPAGKTITLRHAEVLEHGELGVRPLRFAKATDSYTSRGDGPATWSPRFTFHGFRYAEVSGWPGEVDPKTITAVVIHNDMVRTGWLETSNPKLDQLHSNVLWGMRGNFLSLPTDCPQRDERLGWTGDIQVFTPTASYLYDSAGFLGSWLRDLDADQQRGNGVVPFVVPNPLAMPPMPAAAWGDAATLVPDALFTRFGDRGALRTQYASMRSWVDTVDGLAGDDHLWTGGFQFGDWLDPSAPPENPAAAKTDSDIVATAYFYRSTAAVAAAAEIVGETNDASRYATLAHDIREAFTNEYVTPAGRLLSDAHTAYALAIGFGLLTDPHLVAKAGARLAELVRSHGYRIGTGFVGTPLICDALCIGGQSDVAYRMLLEEDCPSWLYPIGMGATTIWERWDSMLPDGSINPGEMTSFNHYALGAVADWMHRAIGGLAPGAPGYRVVDIAPILGGGITHARARLETGYGPVEVAWQLEGMKFSMQSVVPPNASARVRLPGTAEVVEVGSGRHEWVADVTSVVTSGVRMPLSLATSLSTIVGDSEARMSLEKLFTEMGYVIGLGWTTSGSWKSGTPLSSSLVMMPAGGVGRIEALFAELNTRRGL